MQRMRLRRLLQERNEVFDGTTSDEMLSLSSTEGVARKNWGAKPPRSVQDSLGYKLVRAGDLVFNPMWAAKGGVAVAWVNGYVSPAYRVYCVGAEADPQFLHYLLRSPKYLSLYASFARGTTTYDRAVSPDDFLDLWVSLPDLAQQQEVAARVQSALTGLADSLSDANTVRNLLVERADVRIHETIFSESARLMRVTFLADYINGRAFKPDDFSETGLPVVRIEHLLDPGAACDTYDGDVDDRHLLRDGDIVFSWSATLAVERWARGKAILNQHLFRVLPRPEVDPQWLYFALRAALPAFRSLAHGSTMTHLTRTKMHQVKVPFPELTRQRELAAALTELHHQTMHNLQTVDEVRQIMGDRVLSLTHRELGEPLSRGL